MSAVPFGMVPCQGGCPLWPVPRAQVGMAMVNRCAPMASGPVAGRQAIDAGPFSQVRGSFRGKIRAQSHTRSSQLSKISASIMYLMSNLKIFESEGRPGPVRVHTTG
jgi:hypothetical protein